MATTVFRVVKDKNFTVMSNCHLRDKHLSLKAKGLLSIILSLPDDWDYSLRGLESILKEQKSTIGSVINELIDQGYIERIQDRRSGGRFGQIEYVIYESPDARKSDIKNKENAENTPMPPCPKKPYTVNVDTDEKGKPPCPKKPGTVNVDTDKKETPPCPKKPRTEKPYTENLDTTNILNNKPNTKYKPNTQSIQEKTDSDDSPLMDEEDLISLLKMHIGYDSLEKSRKDMTDSFVDVIRSNLGRGTYKISGVELTPLQVQKRILKLRFSDLEDVSHNVDLKNIVNPNKYIFSALCNAAIIHDLEKFSSRKPNNFNFAQREVNQEDLSNLERQLLG